MVEDAITARMNESWCQPWCPRPYGDITALSWARLALGAAILHRPAILFLDEPTSGVDPSSRRRLWDLIHTLSDEGVSVLVSTHYMDEAEYCHRIALINRGRLIALGTPHALKQSVQKNSKVLPSLEDTFVALVETNSAAQGASA